MQSKLFIFKSFLLLIALLIPFVVAVDCTQKQESNALATFDGGYVNTNEYIDYYLSSTKYQPGEIPENENLKEIVLLKAFESMAVFEAIDQGIEKDSVYIESVEKNKRKTLFFRYMQDEIINKVINDSLINVYYGNFSPQYQVSYIVRPLKDNMSAAYKKSQKDSINFAYKLLQSGAKFEDVVVRFSQDISTNKKGGNLGYVTSESLGDAELRKALISMPQFSYTKPIKGYEAFYIMHKGAQRDVKVPPFEEARGKIWQSLYRSRKHDIQAALDHRFEMLAEKYNFKVNENVIDEILKKAGLTVKSLIVMELDFDKLNDADMSKVVATYKDGKIKVYEFFEEKCRKPGNKLEFNERFDLLKERHLLSKHAMELGYEKDPEIAQKMQEVRISLLRSYLYKKKVVDKVADLKNVAETGNNEFQEAAIRRKLKEELEKDMRKKYHFEYIQANFKHALDLAKEKKIAQDQKIAEKK